MLSRDEVMQFLEAVKAAKHHADPDHVLRRRPAHLGEAVRLTVSAVDSQRMVLRVEKGKGQKDGAT